MDKNNIKKIISLWVCLFTGLLLCSCSDDKGDVLTEGITLNKGAFYRTSDSKLVDLQADGNVEEKDYENYILNYNSESSRYLYFDDAGYYIRTSDSETLVEEQEIFNYSLSPNGKYLFYFINNQYLVPKVMDLNSGEKYQLNNKATISGQYIGWIDSNRLAYYGVDVDTKKSGIYVYDLESEKEELLYDINGGFVSYLKSLDDSIAFCITTLSGQTNLMILEADGTSKDIADNITEIYDVERNGEDVFLLGRIADNVYSLYRAGSGEIKRLVFDFPTSLDLEKGLSVTENGEILFIGSTSTLKEEKIYKYSEEMITLAYDEPGEYTFIYIN